MTSADPPDDGRPRDADDQRVLWPAPVRFDFGPPPVGSDRPETIVVRPLARPDVEVLAFAFRAVPWPVRPAVLFRRYLNEQADGDRLVLVADADDVTTGYASIAWSSGYAPFRADAVPEISDVTVLPAHRRRGIASALFDVVEGVVAVRSPVAGIGCGLHAGFGPAQVLCARRGYVPDGRGVHHAGRPVARGSVLRLDDTAALMLTKRVR